MNQWVGKLALVTGASSGIGAAIVKDLAQKGVNVVALARRLDRLQKLCDQLNCAKGKVYPLRVDLTKDQEIVDVFNWVKENLNQPVQILVNNAGTFLLTDIKDGATEEWRNAFDVNVMAVGSCTREFFKSLNNYGTLHGHIINICSIAGLRPINFVGIDVYGSTKYALKAITDGLRRDLANNETLNQIRVTTISPGLVDTELFDAASADNLAVGSALAASRKLTSVDISNAVAYALAQPENVSINELVIQPTGERF